MPAPAFLCPHTEHQFDIREPVAVCVRIVDVPVRGNSAPLLRGIFSHGRRPRAPLGPPLRALNIFAPFRFALRYSVSFFYIPSRPASRFACRSCVSPYVSLGVSFCVFCLSYRPCVSSFRFAFHACPWAMVFDMGTVLPCSPLTLPCRLSRFVVLYFVSPCVLPCVPFCVLPCVPFMRLARRLVIASRFHCLPWDAIRLSYGRRFALLAAPRLALRLVLGVCVSALYAALAFRLASRVLCRSSFLFCVSALRLAIACRFCRLPIGGVFIRHSFALLAAHFVVSCRA